MKKILVICYGYLGDHLFASSIAKKLLDEDHSVVVDYVVGFPQVIPLFKNNPFINQVIFDGRVTSTPTFNDTHGMYDRIIQLGPISLLEPPCVELQRKAGIKSPTPEFKVYTDLSTDMIMDTLIDPLRIQKTPIVAVMNGWQPKAFHFSEYEYWHGEHIPNKGYGGRLRDIPSIIDVIKQHFIVIMVGAAEGATQFDTAVPKRTDAAPRFLFEEASLLKHCDYFVGAEGGLANLASGVGCKTIIGSEFLAMLYGGRGCINPVGAPALGPHLYFPTAGHSMLNPFLTDEEFADTVVNVIKHNLCLVYDWKTNTGGKL